MKFQYQHTADFGQPLRKRLGNYPRIPDLTWDFLRGVGSWLSVLFIRTQFRLTVEGSLPQSQRLAIVANHQSHLDTATLLAALPMALRKKTVVLAAEDYFFRSAPKAMAASLLCQGVSFDRLHWTAVRGWYQHLKKLKQGWLLFYPSGSRHSQTIQTGLLKILLKEGWQILPARLEGADEAWPSHASMWRPFRPLKVTFYDPFQGHDLDGLIEKLKKDLYPMSERQTPAMKPDLGLYQTKYLLRDLLRKIPGVGSLSPNVLSILGVIPGLLAAMCLYQGYWLGAIASILGRMIINTMDGLVAEEFNKKSHIGGYLNRLPGEFTDILIVLALWPHAALHWILALIILTGWVQVFGLLGLAAGGPTQSVGPCGQTDRLAILMVGCALAFFKVPVWPTLIPLMCAGCALTILLRVYRSIREIRKLDNTQDAPPC